MQTRWAYSLMRNCLKNHSSKQFPIQNRAFCSANLASTSTTATNHSNETKKTHINDFLKGIVEEYSNKNQTFLLPWADDEAIQQIQRPFQQLLDTGINEEFLRDACLTHADFFQALTRNGPQAIETINILQKTTGQSYENVMRFFAKWMEELLSVSPQRIQAAMNVFLTRGILAGSQLIQLINRCPAVLFSKEPNKMDQSLEYISSFFHAEEIKLMVLASPQICLRSVEELELRYEYIYFHMAIESREFPECACWMDLELEEIMMRHEFLKKTGQYILPDPKRPQFKKDNPKMFRIFDTDDATFATQVARVSTQEWFVFKELYAKEADSSDKERPYDRVKPWLRKAYQRRQQEGPVEKPEGVIEDF